MNSKDRILDVSQYLGDPKTADWVAQGEPLIHDSSVLLTMPAKSVGTVLASTEYMWYGTVKAKLKTSRGAGVVTAFILFSDVKDEIDYEFVGVDLTTAQTNYYFQGIPNYDNSGNITGISDTFNNFHEYEIRWTPDQITWLVDGKVGRTKQRSETWNATANQWNYPQTPSRIQLSIWPGGLDTNAPGTIQWAGGPIDWNGDDIKNYGYYFATFGQIEVQCWNATSGPGTSNHVSYSYNDIRATNDTVVDSDKPTILKSFAGTGLNMDAGSSSGSASDPSGTATAANPAASIPGGGSGAPGAVPGTDGSSGSGSGTGTAANCQATSFTQACGSSGSSGSKSEGGRTAERALGASSAFAVVVAVAGLLWL